MLENVPFQPHQGVPLSFCDCATRRALTSLEEKIKVCERPDRLGSASNPKISELGLAGLESSMTDKLWNKWKQGTHLRKSHISKQHNRRSDRHRRHMIIRVGSSACDRVRWLTQRRPTTSSKLQLLMTNIQGAMFASYTHGMEVFSLD